MYRMRFIEFPQRERCLTWPKGACNSIPRKSSKNDTATPAVQMEHSLALSQRGQGTFVATRMLLATRKLSAGGQGDRR